jgi:signal transduction histidine kinase
VGPVADGSGFYVADDGPGLPESVREHLVDSPPAAMRTAESTGLGLLVVRRAIEAHGWELTVTELPTGGTRFEITGLAVREE